MALPKYLSETVRAGGRTYLVEVRQHSRGHKYMIITELDSDDEDGQPLIVFRDQMRSFMRVMQRASHAVLTKVPELKGRTSRPARKKSVAQPVKKRPKANPPEFCNSGKAWSEADDELLRTHFEKGTDMATLMKMLKRRSGAIQVRLYKLGLGMGSTLDT